MYMHLTLCELSASAALDRSLDQQNLSISSFQMYIAGNESADQAVENLLQRVADGVLSEDRREALEHLRDLMSESAKVCTPHA